MKPLLLHCCVHQFSRGAGGGKHRQLGLQMEAMGCATPSPHGETGKMDTSGGLVRLDLQTLSEYARTELSSRTAVKRYRANSRFGGGPCACTAAALLLLPVAVVHARFCHALASWGPSTQNAERGREGDSGHSFREFCCCSRWHVGVYYVAFVGCVLCDNIFLNFVLETVSSF